MDKSKTRRSPYVKPEDGDNVVITGMSGWFPDSRNIHHFRDNLFNKVDLISGDFRRWKPLHPEVPQRTGKMYDIEKFDLGFFGVTTGQSYNMDPMVRLLLERTVEAIIDAGYCPADFENTNTGVFVGTCNSETERCVYYETLIPSTDAMTGAHRSMYAARMSYYLKLKGMSFITDTACSSSAYAIEEAYCAIREGLCDKAFVCGTNLCLIPAVSLQFTRLGVLSKDGASKSFDARGNGYVRSESCVVILLEKAKDAKRIYSELIYAKTNCDGFKTKGITFPSSELQKALMRDFYDECHIDPTQLTFMEAHGTGTKAGDPEELSTLDDVFCIKRTTPLLIGSVKSNIGHTEPASGLCSIVKAILAMETGFIPPNINYMIPRPESEGLVSGRMVVVTEKTPLPDQRGLIGVNSFGFGGANAHLLLHWNPKAKINDGQPSDCLPRLLCISGRTKDGIAAILNDFQSRKCDAEYAYIIHVVNRKNIEGYLYRGYGIFDKTGEIKKSISELVADKPQLYFVFTNFSGDVLKVAPHLMEIPIFAVFRLY
ncbi:Ketoacyl-synthetase C-terminal extension [Popillia japonica]|uniref:Ketoacyl-synthetase C-terminal extension n=1 Tax=Popillia japonica TaxID=7064 RepID=A0AAW1MG15_POPJA